MSATVIAAEDNKIPQVLSAPSAVLMTPKISAGENRRKREAMDALVVDVVRGTDDNVASCLRIALEVKYIYTPLGDILIMQSILFISNFPN